jgi:acyl carrier protein
MNADVLMGVRECLAESLALQADEIEPGSRLIDDLGADSLDFLDILFSLEQRFELKLRSMDLDALLRVDLSADKLVEKRFIPRAEIDRMAQWLPALAAAKDRDHVTPRMLYSYLTVESLVILVERKQGEISGC